MKQETTSQRHICRSEQTTQLAAHLAYSASRPDTRPGRPAALGQHQHDSRSINGDPLLRRNSEFTDPRTSSHTTDLHPNDHWYEAGSRYETLNIL